MVVVGGTFMSRSRTYQFRRGLMVGISDTMVRVTINIDYRVVVSHPIKD